MHCFSLSWWSVWLCTPCRLSIVDERHPDCRLRRDETKLAQNHIASFLSKTLPHFIYSNIYTCDRWRRHFVPQIIVPTRHTVYQTKNTATLNKQITCVSFLEQHLFTLFQQFQCILSFELPTSLIGLSYLSSFSPTLTTLTLHNICDKTFIPTNNISTLLSLFTT